ncbi:hypothetical protein CBR_g36837 [Chara braunii]|uniref:NET domain-containing protein n=1 Tax=Chara braunii TaxID=69332 RepID=A0A388LLW5_CHABU|nr:hypothetical protein CBR_g36837 [Chara braunii]|eukprot:GBG83223.1 hypothetical protein CBR_g36837 [Chara braunii]
MLELSVLSGTSYSTSLILHAASPSWIFHTLSEHHQQQQQHEEGASLSFDNYPGALLQQQQQQQQKSEQREEHEEQTRKKERNKNALKWRRGPRSQRSYARVLRNLNQLSRGRIVRAASMIASAQPGNDDMPVEGAEVFKHPPVDQPLGWDLSTVSDETLASLWKYVKNCRKRERRKADRNKKLSESVAARYAKDVDCELSESLQTLVEVDETVDAGTQHCHHHHHHQQQQHRQHDTDSFVDQMDDDLDRTVDVPRQDPQSCSVHHHRDNNHHINNCGEPFHSLSFWACDGLWWRNRRGRIAELEEGNLTVATDETDLNCRRYLSKTSTVEAGTGLNTLEIASGHACAVSSAIDANHSAIEEEHKMNDVMRNFSVMHLQPLGAASSSKCKNVCAPERGLDTVCGV